MADVRAGTWHLIGDGVITESVDVHFEIVLRRAGAPDAGVVAWNHHFDPLPNSRFDAQPLDIDSEGLAIAFEPGDRIVFRYTGASATNPNAYIPNGDGALSGGRNPAVSLPH